jgi:hypothetical protein
MIAYKTINTIGELRKWLEIFPDEMKIRLADPNFYNTDYDDDSITLEVPDDKAVIRIKFPCVEVLD